MITLEVSNTDIRLMETDGSKVTKWASHFLEPGMFEEEVISDTQALGVEVKRLMNSSGMQAKNVVASVSGLYSLSRIVTVPAPPGESIAQQAVLEVAEEVMPLSEEELYLSWQVIGTGENGQQVLVVGVPRDVIDGEVQALRAVGINPRVLELKALALARAVNRRQALIMNVEPTVFDIVMIADGIVEVMRTTAWQHDEFTTEERADYLTTALGLTVSFFNSRYPEFPFNPATPLFITGQLSGDPALMEKLRATAEYNIEPISPPLEYPEHMPVSQYAVNIGLALRGMASSKKVVEHNGYLPPDINLLPQAYRPWKPSTRQMYSFCGLIAAIVLLLPVYQMASAAIDETTVLQTRYNALNNLLQQKQLEIKNREPLQQAIAEYNSIVDMGGGFTEDLRVINSEADKLGMDLQSVVHSGNSITIICQADSHTKFRDYLNALEESGRFASPIPPPEGYPYVKGGTVTLEPVTNAD